MILQPISKSKKKKEKEIQKSIYELFDMGELKEVYDFFVSQVAMHVVTNLIMACCGWVCHFGNDYSLYGSYVRKMTITDVRRVIDPNGKVHWVEEEVKELKIQRIICHHEEERIVRTHALLFQLFVPYEHYSLRAILYYVMLYSQSRNKSVVCFCAENGIEVDTFYRWMHWLKEHAPDLLNIGIWAEKKTSDLCRRFIEMIEADYTEAYKKVVDRFQCSFFQSHESPANSERLSGEPIIA